jgi:NAD(P)-dependent dehydrogenase (short-subunit alcohol dehydrogenase family)
MTQSKQGVAVVTGGSSGIGEACARRFAKDGYDVAIIDLDKQGADRVAQDLGNDGIKVGVYSGDVADAETMSGGGEQVEAQLGPVSVLVTSAGIHTRPTPIRRTDLEAPLGEVDRQNMHV